MKNLYDEEIHEIGANPLSIPSDVVSTAVYDKHDIRYRYLLTWIWDPKLPSVAFLMMNPSVASETCADRTLLKCYKYAKRWGYGTLYVVNSAAYRVTDQSRLGEVPDPVGMNNYHYINEVSRKSDMFIAAYGTPHHKIMKGVGENALSYVNSDIHVLELSTKGIPKHPLYLKEDLNSVLWKQKETPKIS